MALINVNADNFEEEVLGAEQTVILDFWAEWCGPCMMLAPVLHEVAEENAAITVGKVNVDEEPALAQAYGISSIPTLIVIKNGKEVKRSVGVIPKAKIEELVKSYII